MFCVSDRLSTDNINYRCYAEIFTTTAVITATIIAGDRNRHESACTVNKNHQATNRVELYLVSPGRDTGKQLCTY